MKYPTLAGFAFIFDELPIGGHNYPEANIRIYYLINEYFRNYFQPNIHYHNILNKPKINNLYQNSKKKTPFIAILHTPIK